MPQLVQFSHAESRGSESEHYICEDKYNIEETKDLCLQTPPIPFFQENVLLQFYGFRVTTIKVLCFAQAAFPQPRGGHFSPSLNSP